eukprot:gene16753-21374_t
MILAHGIEQVELFATLAGVGEIALALWLLLAPRSPWPLLLAATSLVILLLDVALLNPTMLRDAFNPVSLNIAGLALCAIAWRTRPTSSEPEYPQPEPSPVHAVILGTDLVACNIGVGCDDL